jgi:hypothetical protein
MNLPVRILPAGTCLVRGAHNSDMNKSGRWFGYYGEEKDLAKFCASKRFVSTYTRNEKTYEYYKVLRNIPLLSLPYISLYMYNEEEMISAVDIATVLVRYVTTYGNKSAVVSKNGIQTVLQDIIQVLVDEGEENMMATENQLEAYKSLLKLKETLACSESSRNPDYIFASLICELGFLGWIRYGSSDTSTAADEVYICNIHDIEKFKYMEQSESCNLGNCD